MILKRLLLSVLFVATSVVVFAQAGGFTNTGQDVFRWDANSATGSSLTSLVDASGNAQNALNANSAANFNAAASKLTYLTGDQAASLLTGAAFTVEGMFKPLSTISDPLAANYVLERSGSTNEGTLVLSVNRGRIKLMYDLGAGPLDFSPACSFDPVISTDYMHVAFTKSSVTVGSVTTITLNLFYNGVLVSTTTTTTVTCSVDYDLAEGSTANSYLGFVDNIRFWGIDLGTPKIKASSFAEITSSVNLLQSYLFASTYVSSVSSGPLTYTATSMGSLNTDNMNRLGTAPNMYMESPTKGLVGFSYPYTSGKPLTPATAYKDRYIYAVIETPADPGGTLMGLPQILYKEGSSSKGYSLFMNNSLLTFAHYAGSTGVAYVTYPSTLLPSTRYIIEARVTNNNSGSTKIALYVNGQFVAESSAFNGMLSFATGTEAGFGIAAQGGVLYDAAGSAVYSGYNNAFKGKIFEYAIRSSENQTQQQITTNFFSTQYGIALNYLGSSDIPDLFNEVGAYTFQPAGMGYTSSTDNQLTTNSDIRIKPGASAPNLAFWAHNGFADNVYDIGYNSNTQNAPLNVKLQKREWLVTGKSGEEFGYEQLTISVPAGKYNGTIPAGQQLVAVLDMNNDGDYRTGVRVVVLKLNIAGTEYVAENIPVRTIYEPSDYMKIRIGYLNQYEFASGFASNFITIGSAYNYEKLTGTSSNNLLTIDNASTQGADDYILVQDNNVAITAFNGTPLVLTDQANQPMNVSTLDRVWRFNVYGTPGTVDLRFNAAMLPALPAGRDRYVILLDQDGVFDAATTKVYGLTDIGSDKKAFFQNIPDGWHMKVGAAKLNVLQASSTSAVLVQPFINNATLNINVSEQNSFDLASACAQELSKLDLNVTFNTGASHKSGGITFTATANIIVKGYSDYAGLNQLFSLPSFAIAINQDSPEGIWHADLLGYYPNLKQLRVELTTVTTNAGIEPLIKSGLEFHVDLVKTPKVKVPNTTTSVVRDLQFAKADAAQAASAYVFNWKTDECAAVQYQFQLLRLYNEKPEYTTNPAGTILTGLQETSITTTIDWSKALIIETNYQTLQLLLTEGTGFYAWRVRPIGNYYPGGAADSRNWGNWSSDNYPIANTLTLTTSNLGSYGNSIFWYDQFERGKNFMYERTFTEGGNIHESMTYATGLLKGKQSITRLTGNGVSTSSADQELLVSQTVYDFAGRPALNSLPAPTSQDNDISYQELFLQNNNQLYTPFHFDAGIPSDVNATYKNPLPVDGGAMNTYYSDVNPDKSIPSAQGYGFTRNLFDDDGTNAVIEQSGVGPEHRITSDRVKSHTVKVAYAGVSDEELILVFGDEAPKDSTVFKTITTDQNNITSVTYTDKEGKVIATCLAKRNTVGPNGEVIPFYTDALESEGDPAFKIDIRKVIDNNSPYGDGGLQASHTFYFTEPTTVDVSYEITPSVIKDVCGSYCATCGYVLHVNIICLDDPTDPLRNKQYEEIIEISTNDNNDCTPIKIDNIFEGQNSVSFPNLPPGKYSISKQIVPSRAEAETFATHILDEEQAEMTTIMGDVKTALANSASTEAFIRLAYMTLINNAYSDSDYDVQIFNSTGTLLGSTVGLTSGSYTGLLENGYQITVQTSCCSINVTVAYPAYNPCNDDQIVSAGPTGTVTDGDKLAITMMEVLATYEGIDTKANLPTPYDYTNFKLIGDQSQTLKPSEWNSTDFKDLIDNLSEATPMSRNQCMKLWDCWNASVIAILPSTGTPPGNSQTELQEQYDNAMPDGESVVSGIGTTMPAFEMNVVELLLDCYGRDYKAFTTSPANYKLNAFRFFYRDAATMTGNSNYCDKMFCADQDLAAVPPNITNICEDQTYCQITYPGFAGFLSNTFQTVASNNGHSTTADTHTDNQALKGCLTAFSTTPGLDPAVTLTHANMIANAEVTRQKMIGQCQLACTNRQESFKIAIANAFDPQQTGSYSYNHVGVELQLNGNFDDVNGQGWKHIGGTSYADASFVNYMQRYNLISYNNGYYGIQSAANLIPGNKYTVTVDFSILTNYDFGISVVNGTNVVYNTTSTGDFSKTIEFVATASTLQFRYDKYFSTYNNLTPYVNTTPQPAGSSLSLIGYAQIKNVSVRQIVSTEVMTQEDICCMANSMGDYCKNACALDLVIQHCDLNPANDKLISIGTTSQLQKMAAVMAGSFQIKATSGTGTCDAGWENITTTAADKVPGECTSGPVTYGPATLQWDKAYFKGPLKDMLFDNNYLWAITGTHVYKLNAFDGTKIWEMSFTDHPFTQIALTKDGGFVLAGGSSHTYLNYKTDPLLGTAAIHSLSPADAVENVLATDFVISKFTASGTKLSTYTNTTAQFEQLYDIMVTADNGVIMIGGVDSDGNYAGEGSSIQSGTAVLDRAFAIKVKSDFTGTLWTQTYANPSTSVGAWGGRAISITPGHTSGTYVIGAELASSTPLGVNSRVFTINESTGAKIDDQLLYITTPQWRSIVLGKIIRTSDGYAIGGSYDYYDGAVLGGQLTSTGTLKELFLLKVDKNLQLGSLESLYPTLSPSAATPTWLKSFGKVGHDVLTNLIQTADGSFIITTPTMYMVKVDALGNKVWENDNLGIVDQDVIAHTSNFFSVYGTNIWGGFNYQPGNTTPSMPRLYVAPDVNSIFIDPVDGKMIVGMYKRHKAGVGSTIRQVDPVGGVGVTYPYDSWIAKISKTTTIPCNPRNLCIKWNLPAIPTTLNDPILTQPPYEPPVEDPSDPSPTKIVAAEIETQTAQCAANRHAELVQLYMDACVQGKINDLLEVSYGQSYHHYTLYYYDRAGNLARTVPPAGVEPLDVPLSQDALDRKEVTHHRLVTKYEYNSIGQLVSQKTPDGGATAFMYNAVGQLRFSQNAQQLIDLKYSYTKYDALGRIIEVGESTLAAAGLSSFAQLATYVDAYGAYTAFELTSFPVTGNSQQTNTVYSTPASQISYLEKGQTYLRNRVSYTYTYAKNGERAVTYFSYDPHGNVNWLVQELPGQSRNTIAYEYDLISNKVLVVKYNEGQNDAYYHKYSYNSDDGITAVFTSRDQIQWDQDASYSYYKHGPLKRVEIGEDDVQGVDYTYTIQGWLKAINNPSLLTADDYSQDGNAATSSFAGDEFGMVLNYYKGDFVHTGSIINNPKTGMQGAYAFNADANRELFNGNISSWVSRTQEEYRNYLLTPGSTTAQYNAYTTANYYAYDDLNRIVTSAFASYSGSVVSPNNDTYVRAGATGKFATAYSYDGNGNINTLKRYSVDNVTGASKPMDNMQYKYIGAASGAGAKAESNQLEAITEDAAINDLDFTDDIDQFAGTRYVYDGVGNLTWDKAEGILIEWTVYGKVAAVICDADHRNSTSKPEVRYTYDAMGNRIKKEVNRMPYTSGGVAQRLPDQIETTYYVRDASGNVMSTYFRHNDVVSGETGFFMANYDQIEIPIYGNERVGVYKPGSEKNVATKKFQASDLDNMLYERTVSPRTNYDLYWNMSLRENINITNSTSQSIAVSSSSLWNTGNTGNASTSTYTFTKTKAYLFAGKTANGIAHGLNAAGAVQFTAVTADDYFGSPNKLLILSGGNGLMMKGAEQLTADPKAQIAITAVPGNASQYYVITRNTLGSIEYRVIDMSLPGYGTAMAPQGEVLSNAYGGLLDNPFNLYTAGKSFFVRENASSGKTILYATRYSGPGVTEPGQVDIIAITLTGNINEDKVFEVMCQPYGLIQSAEEQGELAMNAKGDKLIYYNQKKRMGWFAHQESQVLVYELGVDGKLAKNAVAAKYTISVSDASLPGSSVSISNDGRFIYYGKDQVYSTNGSPAHIWRYDTRNGSNVEVTGQNVAGDLRYIYSGLFVTVADNKSSTALSLKENDQGTTLPGTNNVVFTGITGKISNLPLQNMRIYGGSSAPLISMRRINNKQYELNDHLGNVTVVVSDRKNAVVGTGVFISIAQVASYTNYYAFGMAIKPRSGTSNTYRYGFNGKEIDKDIGGGACYDYGFRIYDARIAKFLSVDPLSPKYPELTPYQFASNTPIMYIDIDGLEGGKKPSTPAPSTDGCSPDPEKLKTAAKAGVKNAIAKQGDLNKDKKCPAACNYGVQAAFESYSGLNSLNSKAEGGYVYGNNEQGVSDDSYARANDIARALAAGEIPGFTLLQVDITTQEGKDYLKGLADQGYFIVGAYGSNTSGTGGHVVMFVPGEMSVGKSWPKGGGLMPQVMDTGINSRSEQCALTQVMGGDKTKAMKFYIYGASAKIINEKGVKIATQKSSNAVNQKVPLTNNEFWQRQATFWERQAIFWAERGDYDEADHCLEMANNALLLIKK